ncbi:Fatty acid/phospholipid biosynthesis enzyme [Butyrivibrio fibrisolvens 16/4]|nr:Fatty acid/phospholipid biosynthesis enzyme [Butyrivibrio fibrisolvens 16/4]
MGDYTVVALDAMGGDNAPKEMVKGAVDAVNLNKEVKVILVGKEDVIKSELQSYSYPADQIEIKNATEVIETAEHPVMAIKRKRIPLW